MQWDNFNTRHSKIRYCNIWRNLNGHRAFKEHYHDVIWALRRLKAPPNPLAVSLFRLRTKEKTKAPHNGAFIGMESTQPLGSPHKEPTMRKASPCHGLHIIYQTPSTEQRGQTKSSQWRHNERDGVSNHRRLDCLLNRLFRRESKKTSKLRVTGLGEENPAVIDGFPSKRSITQKIFPFDDVIMSSSWRHHVRPSSSELNLGSQIPDKYIDVSVQDYSISIALAIEILQSCTKLSIRPTVADVLAHGGASPSTHTNRRHAMVKHEYIICCWLLGIRFHQYWGDIIWNSRRDHLFWKWGFRS